MFKKTTSSLITPATSYKSTQKKTSSELKIHFNNGKQHILTKIKSNLITRLIRKLYTNHTKPLNSYDITPISPGSKNNKNTHCSSSVNDLQTAAGHANTFVTLPNNYIAKRTEKKETIVYSERENLGISGIIPKSMSENELSKADKGLLLNLTTTAITKDQKVLIMENLKTSLPKKDCIELDIKLGSKTAFKSEIKSNNRYSMIKLMKHKALDHLLDSEKSGYRVEGKIMNHKAAKDVKNLKAPSGFLFGLDSDSHVLDSLRKAGPKNQRIILEELKSIRNKMKDAPVSFVASSIFLAIDIKEPKNTKIKLIDLAHPAYDHEENFNKIKDNLMNGLDKLIETVQKSIPNGETTH